MNQQVEQIRIPITFDWVAKNGTPGTSEWTLTPDKWREVKEAFINTLLGEKDQVIHMEVTLRDETNTSRTYQGFIDVPLILAKDFLGEFLIFGDDMIFTTDKAYLLIGKIETHLAWAEKR